MAAVSETIVREFFELHGFLVRQQRKHLPQGRRVTEDEIDFFVLNPHAQEITDTRPFILGSADLSFINRAVVVVKGWHTETFSSAVLSHSPEILRFVEPRAFQSAVISFGKDGTPLKVLVVPALPKGEPAKNESIRLLKSRGVDAVISFRTILADLISATQTNRNYQKSDFLQLLRILKTYDFFKEPQLELFKPGRRTRKKAGEAQ